MNNRFSQPNHQDVALGSAHWQQVDRFYDARDFDQLDCEQDHDRPGNPANYDHGICYRLARRYYLGERNFIGEDLRGTRLYGVRLNCIDLSRANLRNVQLVDTELIEAKLIASNLSNANLSETNLSRANLDHARLGKARLMAANLTSASLREARLSQGSFDRCCSELG
jgi:hypothetical protein